jgi:tetratricopeptide (TPR) repeat protein
VDPEHPGCKEGYRLSKALAKARDSGEAAMAEGRWVDAEREFSSVLDLDSGLHSWRRNCLLRLARCQRRAGMHQKAKASAELMLKWDDGAAEAHNILAEELLLEENWEEAARRAHRCVAGFHWSPHFFFVRSLTYAHPAPPHPPFRFPAARTSWTAATRSTARRRCARTRP